MSSWTIFVMIFLHINLLLYLVKKMGEVLTHQVKWGSEALSFMFSMTFRLLFWQGASALFCVWPDGSNITWNSLYPWVKPWLSVLVSCQPLCLLSPLLIFLCALPWCKRCSSTQPRENLLCSDVWASAFLNLLPIYSFHFPTLLGGDKSQGTNSIAVSSGSWSLKAFLTLTKFCVLPDVTQAADHGQNMKVKSYLKLGVDGITKLNHSSDELAFLEIASKYESLQVSTFLPIKFLYGKTRICSSSV